MKNAWKNLALLFVSLLIGGVLAELAAQFYVNQVAQQGRLFETDPVTGWKVRPNLDVQRKNADGELWTVSTDQYGLRKTPSQSEQPHKLLILGDSFAFGEGVDVEQRFDAHFSQRGYQTINTGVMGYGTDQQFLAAADYLDTLGSGDVVLVLTYFNDFYDISRQAQSGRAKPWYSIVEDELELHLPQIGIHQSLRDQSYIYARVASLLTEQESASAEELALAATIYQKLIAKQISRHSEAGVHTLVAHHGVSTMAASPFKDIVTEALKAVCMHAACVDIDLHFDSVANRHLFLADGHWNAAGHKRAGEIIQQKITRLIEANQSLKK